MLTLQQIHRTIPEGRSWRCCRMCLYPSVSIISTESIGFQMHKGVIGGGSEETEVL